MATDQVLSWIKNDLSLSQSVANFETDFSNGYLLGEILHHYGLVDLAQFSRKKNKEAKVNNFYLVESALRKLKVRFDGKLIHQIMEEERGASLRLLYQVKLCAQGLSEEGAHAQQQRMSLTNLSNGTINKVLQAKQQRVLEMSKSILPPTVGGKDIRSAKQKRADEHTLQYDVAQKTLFDRSLAKQEEEMRLMRSITQQQRQNNITKLIENQTFMKDWMAEGKRNWHSNQTKRREAIAEVKYFEDREVNIYKTRLQNELTSASEEQINGISDFEKNLQKLGIQQGISMDEAIKKQEEKKGIPPGQIQNFSYAATMNKIKETKKNSDFAGKERDRRRRKMLVDQQNAQTRLDQESKEAGLIAKLLQQTQEEWRDALIDQRTSLCKEFEFEQRKSKAFSRQSDRQKANEEAERVRLSNAKAIQEQRQVEYQATRKELQRTNFEKKKTKRSMNIEIASGLVDLIMDLADETYEQVCASETHQIDNPTWREFLTVFRSGKKVSLRNIFQAPVVQDPQEQKDRLSIATDAKAHDMSRQFMNDPSLLNFYEYLSGAGAFNIPGIHQQLWNQYEEQYSAAEQDRPDHIPFIDSKLQQNGDLVKAIQRAYDCAKAEQAENEETQADEKEPNILLQSNIRLALIGRACSGRKTLAKQLQESLGNDVSVFHIDDIVKEALDYINPKKAEETAAAVDPKAKKSKKESEPVIVDIFEGKNTANYKAVAQQIKDQYFACDELPKVGVSDLVLDESLLNSLVIERLRFLAQSQKQVGAEQIKAGVVREREILKQLEDLEAAAALAAADPKTAKKAAKGGPDPEKLNAELNDIRSFKATGWILTGFPKQLSQLKMFERELSGFVCDTDSQKPESALVRESWQKLVVDHFDPCAVASLYTKTPQQSGLDALLFLETPDEECIRRAQSREDAAASVQRTQAFNEVFNSKVGSIRQWCEQFGLVNAHGEIKVTLNQSIRAQTWDNKDKVKETALESLKRVVDFKQGSFDLLRQQIKAELDLQSLEKKDDVSQNAATPTRVADDKSQKSKSPIADTSPKPGQILNSLSGFLQENDPASTFVLQNKKSATDKQSHGDEATVKSSKRQKLMMPRYQIDDRELIEKWEQFLDNYYRSSLQIFNNLVKQRSRIFSLFSQTQRSFVQFICRESDYQKLVNQFCDNFNRFSESYPELHGKEETRNELLKRVNILNDTLWNSILVRKNQSVAESDSLARLMENGWETREKSKLISNVSQLMELEFNRLHRVAQMATSWVVNQDIDMGSLCAKLDERAVPTFQRDTNGEPVSPMLNQVVNYLLLQVQQLLSDPAYANQSQSQRDIILRERTNFHLRINTLRVYAILLLDEIDQNTQKICHAFEGWIITSVKRENAVAANVIKTVRQAVSSDQTYIDTVRVQDPEILSSIERVQLSESQPMYQLLATQGQELTPRGLTETRLEVATLRLLFNQFKSHGHEDLLDAQSFITMMIQNYQGYRFPTRWRSYSFSTILNIVRMFAAEPLKNESSSGHNPFTSNEVDSGNEFVNWKKVFVLFALASSPLPSEQDIDEIQKEMKRYGETITLAGFQEVEAWYDATESADTESQILQVSSHLSSPRDEVVVGEVYDSKRLREVKELLWHTVKRTNETGVRAEDFARIMTDFRALAKGRHQMFGDLIC